jgi:hypothetical protein
MNATEILRWRDADVIIPLSYLLVGTLTLVAMALGLSPAVRLPLVILSGLTGPGTFATRLLTARSWTEAFAVGVALNIAFIMLVAQFMVLTSAWYPALGLGLLVLVGMASAGRSLWEATA